MGKVKGLYEDLMQEAYEQGFSDGYRQRKPNDDKYTGDALEAFNDGYFMGLQQWVREQSDA